MARFIVTSGSKFTPFSYDDLVKPVAQSSEAHLKAQEALDALALEAGKIGAQIGSGDDTERSRALYDTYMKQLEATAEDLYNNGYGMNAARGVSKARTMYGTDINKIQQAIQQRDARAEEYRKALAQNPTLITEFNPIDKGLDNWLDNPQYGYYRSYSGEALLNQGKLVGENLRREMLRNEQNWRPILGNQYYERIKRTGFTDQELSSALDNVLNNRHSDSPVQSALENAITQVYASSGMSDWADNGQRARALNFIGQGLTSSYGEVEPERVENKDKITAYQHAQLGLHNREIALRERAQNFEEDKWRAEHPEGGGSPNGGLPFSAPTQEVDYAAEKAGKWAKDASAFNKLSSAQRIKTPDGRDLVVHNWKEATSLVYNGRARDEGFKLLGLDVAADPLAWNQSTKSKLTGTVVRNGKAYRCRTEPKKGAMSGITNDVVIMLEVAPNKWKYDEKATNDYTRLRSQVLANRDYYKKNYKDVYDAAISPEREKSLRSDYNLSDNVPTMGLFDAINASPLTQQHQVYEHIVAQSGPNGENMRKQLASQLSTNYTDLLKNGRSERELKRSDVYGIKKITKGHGISGDKVSFSSAFEMDKEGQIKNINEVRVTREALKNDRLLVYTTKGTFSVPVKMFGSAAQVTADSLKDVGEIVDYCLDNAPSLMYAPLNNPDLVGVASVLTKISQTGKPDNVKDYYEVTPADVKEVLSTKEGRESMRKWYDKIIHNTVPEFLTGVLRVERFPAGSLTSSKDTM